MMMPIWPGGNEEKCNRVNSPDSSAGNPQRSMSQSCKVQRVFPRQGEGVRDWHGRSPRSNVRSNAAGGPKGRG